MTDPDNTTLRDKIRLGINHPKLIARKLNKYSRLIPKYDYTENIGVFDKDWDNLIILDSLRYDIANQYDWGASKIDLHRSRATMSREFYKFEIADEDLRDVVCVTANAFITQLADEGYNFDIHESIVMDNDPEEIVQEALSAHEDFQNKRLLIHFMQPHFPPMGDGFENIRKEWYADYNPMNLWANKTIDNLRYDIGKDELISAYKENLEFIMPYANRLEEEFEGKTVITADHGHLFSERVRPIPIKDWGHPRGAYADGILNVPWIVYESKSRKDICVGDAGDVSTDGKTRDRLRDLGYIQ